MNLILTDRSLPFLCAAENDTEYIDLTKQHIHNCVGCFGCWIKTPGRCVIRDDAVRIYPKIAAAERLLYVSRVSMGGYDVPMKTLLERAIPVQKAFIRLVEGETHHYQRAVLPKTATIFAYGTHDSEERELFCDIVARNTRNMNFTKHKVIFTEEEFLETAVREEVASWQRS